MSVTLKLVDIELHNFRLFDNIQVKFDDTLTVLIGENGAGKTALLESIAKALMFYTKNIRNNTVTPKLSSIYAPTDIRYGKSEMQTNLTLSYQKELYKWDITQNDLKKNAVLTPLDSLNRFIDAAQLSINEQLSIVAFYQNSRLYTNGQSPSPKTTQAKTYTALDNALEGGTLSFKTFVEWYIWQEQIEQFDKTLTNTVLNTVRTAICAILNDDMGDLYKQIYIDPTEFNNPRLIIEKGKDKIEVNQLSSGEKSLLVLVSDLARRLALANPLSKNPLKEGQGIVLVDEIDLHLHPRWQRAVIPKLLDIFPKIQWVITTHSPFIIAAEHVTPENAFLLTEDADTKKKVVISIQDLGKQTEGLEPNRILKEIMNVPLRNKETETSIEDLSSLLNLDDFDKLETQKLYNDLLEQLGKQDPFIVRAAHRLSVLERQKTAAV